MLSPTSLSTAATHHSLAHAPAEAIATYAGGGAGDGGLATAAGLSFPGGMAVDSRGNLYVADELYGRIRKITPDGTIETVAGDAGLPPFTLNGVQSAPVPWVTDGGPCQGADCGDGGPASRAPLNHPSDVAVDAAGDLFITDTFNQRVRKVDVNGVISTVAGGGSWDFCNPVKAALTPSDQRIPLRLGDGGPATRACLPDPVGVALDAHGDLFIAEQGLCRVRRIDPTGIITTVAGNGTCQDYGDGGPAVAAGLMTPAGVAVGAHGDLFIADWQAGTIRRVAQNGVISTVAGNGTCSPGNAGDTGDGGRATRAALCGPSKVYLDAAGDLYISDRGGNRVRRVDATTHIITTVAGDGIAAFSGDGGAATSAAVRAPDGVTVDSAGDVFAAEWPDRVRRVDHATGVISSYAGNGSGPDISASTPGFGDGFAGDGLPATAATLLFPQAEALGPDGNLYIADTYNNRVRVVDHRTGTTSTIAGNGQATDAGDGGPAWDASLYEPAALAFSASGDLYVADYGNQSGRVRRIDHTNAVISTVAGGGACVGSSVGDGGAATSACLRLGSPAGLAVDAAGNVYIGDTINNRVREVSANTGIITTVAGNGTFDYFCGSCGDGGPATNASLSPTGLTFDSAGNLFIADTGHDSVREVTASGVITRYAGSVPRGVTAYGDQSYSGDGGPATQATMFSPYGIAFDGAGDLYIAAGGNDAVRMVDAHGIITTVAGVGEAGLGGDGGPPTQAQLNEPDGVAVSSSGTLFIADSGNGRVRAVTPVPSAGGTAGGALGAPLYPPAPSTKLTATSPLPFAPAAAACATAQRAMRTPTQPAALQLWGTDLHQYATATPVSGSAGPAEAALGAAGSAAACVPNTGQVPSQRPSAAGPSSSPGAPWSSTQAAAGVGAATPSWQPLADGTPMGTASTMTYDSSTGSAIALAPNPALDATSTWALSGSGWQEQRQSPVSPHLLVASLAYDDATKQVVLFGGLAFQLIVNPRTLDPITEYPVDETWTWGGHTWTEAHPASTPPMTLDAAMAYDGDTKQVVLFGGYLVDPATGTLTPSDQTWLWDGSNWHMAQPVSRPSPRAGASAAYDSTRHRVVLFGGYGGPRCAADPVHACSDQSDTWTWDGSSWSLAATSGPRARAVTGLADDPATHTVVLFGGAFDHSNATYSTSYETWTWNGTTWTQQHPTTAPGARIRAAMSEEGSGLSLFGGESLSAPGLGLVDDTWTWDGSAWHQLQSVPSARDGVATAYDQARNQLVVFGGESYPVDGVTQLVDAVGDTWTWDSTSGWQLRHPADSPSPGAYGAMAYDAATRQVVLLEGQGCGHRASDCQPGDPGCTEMASCTWTWDGTTWTQQHPAHAPPPLATSAMAYDAATGELVVFGGVALDGCDHYVGFAVDFDNSYPGICAVNDTWTWDGHDWTERHPPHSPPIRWEAGMGYDDATHQVVLFGGWGLVDGGGGVGGFLQDTWTWDGSDWTVRSPTGAPPITRTAGLAFSRQLGQLVMFGGMLGYAEDFFDVPDVLLQNIGGDSFFLNTTWAWNGSSWTQLATRASPPVRGYVSAVASPHGVLVFAGTAIYRYNDIWLFTG